MFWKYNSPSTSQIETILAKENVTLQEIMDEEDILNECKVQNKALIDYLIKPEILQELVTLTTTEPTIEQDERNRFKYPNIACEMLTCDIPSLNESLAGDKKLLAQLYSFLDTEPPLNPLLASFFSKIMAVLIAKKPEQNWLSYQFTCLQVLDFLKAKENFVPLLLNHLGTSAIMDLTLKLMTQVEGDEIRQNILNYLDSQRIIQTLVALLDPKVDRGRHYNVAQLLCDFIQFARDTQRNSTERNDPDPLLNTLESPETVALLLEHILGEDKNETAIVGGVQVLLALLHKTSIPKDDYPMSYSNANYDDVNEANAKQKVVDSTSKVILTRLKDFHNLLLDPPKKEPIMTTVGSLDPPLGNTRLQVTRLLAALISCGGPEIAQEIVSLGTMTVLIDLFFAFPWNNFLHSQVQACVTAALSSPLPSEQGDINALSKHLLVNCKLVERILDAWKDNDDKQLQAKGVRQGFMGHLINIANTLVNLCSDGPLGLVLKEASPEVVESLQTFKDTVLSETNTKQETLLGGVHPHTSNEDSDEYVEPTFNTSVIGQQNYAEYQMQQLGPNFYDSYGYNDDDFKDGDDALQFCFYRSIEHQSGGIKFDLSEGDLVQQHELFKQVCAQNINTLDDADDQVFDEKEHTFQTVIEKETDRQSSSDSEEDNSPQGDDPVMDVEPWNSPNKASEAPMIMTDDPWGTAASPGDLSTTGWADFSSAVFEADFGNAGRNPNAFVKGEERAAAAVVPIETDLKVENIEIDVKMEEKPEKDSIEVAQGHNPEEGCDIREDKAQEDKEQNTIGDTESVAAKVTTTGSTEISVTEDQLKASKEGV